jgi:putative transposase
VKGSLMPRRHYPDLDALEEAVRQALKSLGGIEVRI